MQAFINKNSIVYCLINVFSNKCFISKYKIEDAGRRKKHYQVAKEL